MAKDAVDARLWGADEIIDELERYCANVQGIEEDALNAAAAPILAEARQTSAFIDRSGKLRKSLKVSKMKFKIGSVGHSRQVKYKLIGCFDNNVFYARMVEFGHSPGGDKGKYTPAHPFLEPAFLHHADEATEIIRKKLAEALG